MPGGRRDFIAKLLGLTGAVAGLGSLGQVLWSRAARADTAPAAIAAAEDTVPRNVWVEGKDPYACTVAAIDELGSIKRFVQKGQRVALLPNVGWARTMEQAANTHPEVLRAIIDQCEAAGAKSITAFCNPCNDIRVCLDKSGIGAMVEDSPARFEVINQQGWRARKGVAGCTHLKSAEVYRLVDDCDVLINVPVAKHHGNSQLTMCCKNLMGLVKDRGFMHQQLHEAIADLTMMVPHALCILDASRILTKHGPSGGNLKDVSWRNTIIAGVNPAEVDALGTSLFEQKPADIGYLRILDDRQYAVLDPTKVPVSRIEA